MTASSVSVLLAPGKFSVLIVSVVVVLMITLVALTDFHHRKSHHDLNVTTEPPTIGITDEKTPQFLEIDPKEFTMFLLPIDQTKTLIMTTKTGFEEPPPQKRSEETRGLDKNIQALKWALQLFRKQNNHGPYLPNKVKDHPAQLPISVPDQSKPLKVLI